MKVGDSVLLPDREAATSLRKAANRASIKMTERIQRNRQVRVWRLK
jgi:hypothetical protein